MNIFAVTITASSDHEPDKYFTSDYRKGEDIENLRLAINILQQGYDKASSELAIALAGQKPIETEIQ